MPTKKISEKSTKQELWTAYNSLAEDLAQDSFEFVGKKEDASLPDSLKKLSDLKLTLSQTVDGLSEDLMTEIEQAKNFRKEFAKQKEATNEALNLKKLSLEKEIEKVKQDWIVAREQQKTIENEAERIKKLERQHEEEEYQYNRNIKRRNEHDEYFRKMTLSEQELSKRQEVIEAQEKEFADLKKQVEDIPALLAREVEKTNQNLRKELEQRHNQEVKNLTVAKDNELKISEIKNINLQSQITSQSAEIDGLKKQVTELTKQLKEMAVSAIENRGQNQIVSKSENEK